MGKLGEREGETYETRKRPPRHKQMHTDFRILEVETQMLSERFNSRFTRIVRWVARRIRDALLTSRHHNRAGSTGLETGDVGV